MIKSTKILCNRLQINAIMDKSFVVRETIMSTTKKPSIKIGLILLAYIAFIALGMPDGLLGVGWLPCEQVFMFP